VDGKYGGRVLLRRNAIKGTDYIKMGLKGKDLK
jgi:hypothetical protein